MKHIKKLASLLLAVVMILALATTAFAAPPTSQTFADGNAADTDGKYTISVASTDTHTYTVYQILTGTLVAGESKLGNPAWGSDANATTTYETVDAFITAITVSGLSNQQINAIAESVLKANAAGVGSVTKTSSLDVAPGYYLIKDTTATLNDGDSYSLNIVAVFNDITIAPKKGTTTSDKKVDDNDTDKAADGSEWIDSADYSIGDTVPYKLTATIADDYANYTHGYKLTFHDNMSAGLTFNPNSVVVKVGNTTIESGYTVYENKSGTTLPTGMTWGTGETFMVHFANLKDIASVAAGSVISVEFSATLNENAVITSAGNPNTSHVTYSNNPNDDQAGENGKTPDDTVIVFTYKTVFTKKDGSNNTLTGADFKLEKNTGTAASPAWTDVTELHTGTGAKNPTKTGDSTGYTFTFAGLDAGDYKLTETTTPVGYNTIDPIEFTITATHDILSDNPTLTALTGTDGSSFNMTRVSNSAELDADVINQQGSVLPTTGVIGTTIFYVTGAVLALGAGILLITKRRMRR